MGRMAEITQGYGDAATFPAWAQDPQTTRYPEITLFTFDTTTGTGDEPVTVVAEMWTDTICSEIKSVTIKGVEIASAISWDQHQRLMLEAERQYQRELEER